MTAVVTVDRHRVCCGLLHVKTATWIIAIFHLILVGYLLIVGIVDLVNDSSKLEHHHAANHVNFAGM